MKNFEIPAYYKSNFIQKIKEIRKAKDHYKKDFSPTVLDFGKLKIFLARHFGFCYGVENAIEIAYRTINENPDKRIFLLSEMIHNQEVNKDLLENGIEFVQDSYGNQLIEWDEVSSKDIVIIPAFGTTLETEKILQNRKINTERFNTTCPFVEKVWKKSYSLGKDDYTVIIHGKAKHEETRATFSHAKEGSASVIVRDLKEAQILSDVILKKRSKKEFYKIFDLKYSDGFNPDIDLVKVGVVNQTTMLASETQEIADCLKSTMIKKYGEEKINEHFADTRDTLCYATNDNQQATIELLKEDVDFALVVGGYNSSNTSHIVELLDGKFNTYFISDQSKINLNYINYYDMNLRKEITAKNYMPNKDKINVIITSGASCPDAVVESIMLKLLSFFDLDDKVEKVVESL